MRLRQLDEVDLRWFILDASGCFGLRSSFGAQLDRARAGQDFASQRQGNAELDISVGALRRATRVRDSLRRIGSLNTDVLIAAYCWDRLKRLAWLDRLGPVCLLTDGLASAYQRSQDKQSESCRGGNGTMLLEPLPAHRTLAQWAGPALKNNKELCANILLEADGLLTGACRAWYARRECTLSVSSLSSLDVIEAQCGGGR